MLPTAPVAPPVVSHSRIDWADLNPLADLRVRYGIKVGLAAVLALWVTQVLRLEHPNWSILAVLVLANAHYVGAIATKALMRSVGTVAGALLGVWVVGDYANSPLIFLFLVFVVVAISTYKSGQIATATWPYAYYLVGLALVSAATYGVTDPENVWHYGLYRTLETLVGVVCATFIYSVLWPRHARQEFLGQAVQALQTVRALLDADARLYARGTADAEHVLGLRREFSRRIVGLRTLLVTGGRGSIHFRTRLGNYQRFVVALTHLFQALLELQSRRADEVPLVELVQSELNDFLAALDHDLTALSNASIVNRGLPPVELKTAFAVLEDKVKTLRDQGTYRAAPLDAAEAFFGHFAALRLLHDELVLVHEIAGELPRRHLFPASTRRRQSILPAIDRFWVQEAVKAGVAICLSFVLMKWVHPPGATAIPLGALTFSTFGRSSLTTGGTGDLRSFQRMFLTALTGIPIVTLLWLVMPIFSNYWAMNVLLFVLCYVFGFIVVGSTGFSYLMQIMVLAISTLVGINPQEPVAFGTLRDSFLGLIIGLVIGGTVSRLIWPVLPQSYLRRNLIRFFQELRTLLKGTDPQEFILSNTVLLPLTALQSVDAMILPQCPAKERADLAEFIRLALPLGMQITALQTGKTQRLNERVTELLQEPIAALEEKFDAFIGAMGRCFSERTTSIEFPDLERALAAVNTAVAKVRDEGVGSAQDFASIAHLLELVRRYQSIAEGLHACRRSLAGLSLARYLHDVAL